MDLETPLERPTSASERQQSNRCLLKFGLTGGCLLCVVLVVVVIITDDGRPLKGSTPSTPLDKDRHEHAQRYMLGRLQALQGSDKAAGVAQVLETLVDGGATPVIDNQAPVVERIEGTNAIKKYLEKAAKGQSQIKDENFVVEVVAGVPVIRFVMSEGRKEHRLMASFEFENGSPRIQKVTIEKDETAPVSTLDKDRIQMVSKYMKARIEAFQGSDKAAGVAQVMECFIPDGTSVKPVIDLHAPKKEYAEGREAIQHYLENPPNLPVSFVVGSNTDPVMENGKAIVKFSMKVALFTKKLIAVYEFKEGSALIEKVTVDKDSR